ncbi:MAG TPA: FAD-dependent oxidoreductase [Gemmatimonadaceae bacterium]
MTGDTAVRRAVPRVLIIGGGITGLAAALRVRALDASCSITLVDAAPRLGGKIAGEIVDGCVVDGGADVCIGDKLRATRMFTALDLETRIIRVNPDELPTYERRDGRLQRLPTSFNGELLTFGRGMQEIVDAAWSALEGVTVVTAASVDSLARTDDVWRAESAQAASHSADAVIVATPAHSAAELLFPFAPQEAAGLRALEYPATTTVTIAWRATDVPHPLDGTGYLVADASSRVSACTWTSSKNPSHSPSEIVLLRGYIRGIAEDPVALMREEVSAVLGITEAPLFSRSYEWAAGIPVYPAAHEANVRALGESLAGTPGLFIAGSAFHGIGIPDCIHSGERAAAGAAAYAAARQTEEAA